MQEFTEDMIRSAIYTFWLKDTKKGQNELADEIGLSHYTFRKFLKGQTKTLKIKTRMKMFAWINKQGEI